MIKQESRSQYFYHAVYINTEEIKAKYWLFQTIHKWNAIEITCELHLPWNDRILLHICLLEQGGCQRQFYCWSTISTIFQYFHYTPYKTILAAKKCFSAVKNILPKRKIFFIPDYFVSSTRIFFLKSRIFAHAKKCNSRSIIRTFPIIIFY